VPPPSASALRVQRVHTVVHGETLSKIAQRYYGDAQKWPVIYALPSNKALIGANPSMIRMGMRLTIP
jgi:nucleoid-associated protein YgaU